MSNKTFASILPVTVPVGAYVCTDMVAAGEPHQTAIYFYPDSTVQDGFKMYVQRFDGTGLIGIGSGEISLQGFTNFNPGTDQTCTGNSNLAGLGYNLSGPVEYDQQLALSWKCINGQIGVWINQHQAGSNQPTNQLTCKPLQTSFGAP